MSRVIEVRQGSNAGQMFRNPSDLSQPELHNLLLKAINGRFAGTRRNSGGVDSAMVNSGQFFDQSHMVGHMRSMFGAGAEKPRGTPSFDFIDKAYLHSPIDRVIVGARQAQLQHVATLETPNSKNIGLTIVHKHEDDPSIETSDEKNMNKKLRALELLNQVNEEVHPFGFTGWFMAAGTDHLKWDRVAMVKQRNYKGQPVLYHSVDPTTIRPIVEVLIPYAFKDQSNYGDKTPTRVALLMESYKYRMMLLEQLSDTYGFDFTKSAYVQVIDEQPTAAWTKEEMSVLVTRQDNRVNRLFYGVSALENSLELTDLFLTIWSYNKSLFNQKFPESLVFLKGDWDQSNLEALKQQLYTAGPTQQDRIAMVGSEDAVNSAAEVVKLREPVKDMAFAELMQLVLNLKCASYRLDPSVINFKDMGGGQVQFQQAKSEEMRIASAKEEGLHSLIGLLCTWLTTNIIQPFDPDLQVVPLNLEREDEATRTDIMGKKKGWTVDEIRASDKLPPYPDAEIGQILLSPEGVQIAQMQMAKDQQAQMMQQGGGMGGAGGGMSDSQQPGGGDNQPGGGKPQQQGGGGDMDSTMFDQFLPSQDLDTGGEDGAPQRGMSTMRKANVPELLEFTLELEVA